MMKFVRAALCTLATVCLSAPALAALGGDTSSVEADRATMKGAVNVTPGVDYSVHEIQTPGGGVIREYVSAQDKVFAVSWRGPGLPNLPQLLGRYSAPLAQAMTHPHYNHHHLDLEAADVVMRSGGYLRTRFGRAWVPSLLPQNFSPKDIR